MLPPPRYTHQAQCYEEPAQVDRIWKMVEADNQEAPPPGLEQGFKQELRLLVA